MEKYSLEQILFQMQQQQIAMAQAMQEAKIKDTSAKADRTAADAQKIQVETALAVHEAQKPQIQRSEEHTSELQSH